jgi:diguanylate cyclase (GGDEF)-like protein
MLATPLRVLLFEDDEGHAILTREALEQQGYAVDVAHRAREGLDRLLNTTYALYLIDVKLPDLTGVEVLRRIMTLQPGAVAIIVSGHGDESAAVEAMKLGAHDYVVKSPHMEHLAALPLVMREALDRRRLKVEREELQTEVWEHARLLEERNVELRRANDELKRMDHLKTDLVAMVSHELRTPLATIKEFTAILVDRLAGPTTADQEEYLGIIQTNINRLARIIDDLLDMAKIDAGRVLLTRGYVDLPVLVREVLQTLRPLADSKGLILEAQVPPQVASVFADADKITQVLVNLLSNAIKFTDSGGRITVTLSAQEHDVQVAVADTGPGIDPEHQPKLFEKFQQFRRVSDAHGSKGTGLGLAISKRLVELHGGRIWVTSHPGQGSTFFFTLPQYQMEEVFMEYIKAGLDQARARQVRFSIIVVGVANFQELKAVYGMEETTRLFKQIELALRDTVRGGAGDIVVRWQRGEMVVILAEVDQAGAQAIARRIVDMGHTRRFEASGKPVTIVLTTATATHPDEAATAEELMQVTEQRLQRPAAARTRILVVDDEPKIRQMLKSALELREYEVVTAASGPEALTCLKQAPVDLILLDVIMPVMGGYEVYHLLRENPSTKHTPVIILTARGERKDRELGLDSGAAYNYVIKPFQLDELLAKIHTLLQQRPGHNGGASDG